MAPSPPERRLFRPTGRAAILRGRWGAYAALLSLVEWELRLISPDSGAGRSCGVPDDLFNPWAAKLDYARNPHVVMSLIHRFGPKRRTVGSSVFRQRQPKADADAPVIRVIRAAECRPPACGGLVPAAAANDAL